MLFAKRTETTIAARNNNVVDISADIERFAELGILATLLADRSTGGNIIWASNVFSDKGESYAPEDETSSATSQFVQADAAEASKDGTLPQLVAEYFG